MSAKSKFRIPPLPREEWTDPARQVFSFWGEPNSWEEGSKTNVLMVMAQHPALGTAYNIWGKHLLIDNTVPNRARELIILRVAWRTKSEYEWHYHVGYGLNFGLTLEEIAAIKKGAADPIWKAGDRAILSAIDQLIDDGNIADKTWTDLSRQFDRKQLMDFVLTVGHYVMTSWALNAFGVPLEDGVDPVGFNLKTASGKKPAVGIRPLDEEQPAPEAKSPTKKKAPSAKRKRG
jgi:4-carboxymuconolactone decarboxylase